MGGAEERYGRDTNEHRKVAEGGIGMTTVAYLAVGIMYLAAGRYGHAAIYLVFVIGWAVLARLATKPPAERAGQASARQPRADS